MEGFGKFGFRVFRKSPIFHPVILILTGFVFSSAAEYSFNVDYFEMPVDHFSFSTNKTFKMRYLYNDTYWNKSANGPIFFYTGNEGDIKWFAQNTGFMWDIAPEFQALLLFAEHRYYGDSLPFGNDSFKSPEKTGYLTSEQALADYAEFLQWFRYHRGGPDSPIIAFGGSYGGMLTAWMRIKYPHVIQGGIAASAPIWQYQGITPCNTFSRIVTQDFMNVSSECGKSIRVSWKHLNTLGQSDGGRQWLTTNWKLCQSLNNQSDLQMLKDWLYNVYGNLAMVDYPYAASFLEPLPAYPIKAVCEKLFDSKLPDKQLLRALFKGLNVYFNYTGSAKCLDYGQQATQSLGDLGWDYQACTEQVMPMCNDGVSDIFEPIPWNETGFAESCQQKWKVQPRPYMAEIMYGGKHIQASSNIVFSNGLLDPWSGGGVLESLSDSLISVIIPEGAHHLDLRGSNVNDPPSVIKAREVEKSEIRKWIAQFEKQRSHGAINTKIVSMTKPPTTVDTTTDNEVKKN
ncbi:unnamed protein product [Allacma fusca]|uniref:Lysosomal Pro-X carboxypeptidase n=1 Tax=Allacma fusca TaxID=39272 RepID=A0A8J2JZP3_9HEXA|nr:unnamed protein product [Allacma fusca]